MFTPAILLYFTAGTVPTGPELAAIDILQNDGRYDVKVRDTLGKNYVGGELEAAAFVAGTVPAAYTTLGTPVINPAALPNPTNLPSTAKVINSGVEFLAPAAGGARVDGYTPTIVGGVVTALTGS